MDTSEPQHLLWVRLRPEQGNCDQLPEWLDPKVGCPECGSAWTDVRAVACAATCMHGQFEEEHWFIRQIGTPEPILAVRLCCFNGHFVEYDGTRLKVIPPTPHWALLAAATYMIGAFAFRSAMTARGPIVEHLRVSSGNTGDPNP